jgi:hypothetical protein
VGIDKSKIKIHADSAPEKSSKVKKMLEQTLKTPIKTKMSSSRKSLEIFSPNSSKINQSVINAPQLSKNF